MTINFPNVLSNRPNMTFNAVRKTKMQVGEGKVCEWTEGQIFVEASRFPSLETGDVPYDMKEVLINPISKKPHVDKDVLSIYWPLSNPTYVSKLIE